MNISEQEFEERRRKRNRRIVWMQQSAAGFLLLPIIFYLFKDADFTFRKETIFFPWVVMVLILAKVYALQMLIWPANGNPPDVEANRNILGNPGLFTRILLFITWNTLWGLGVWKFFTYYASGLGTYLHGLITVCAVVFSIASSFDMNSIPKNHKGQIAYWNKYMFFNLSSGFTLIGLPRWVAFPDIDPVSNEKRTYEIGHLKPFKVEVGNLYAAIIKVAYDVIPTNTAALIQFQGDQKKEEDALTLKLVAAIRKICNQMNGSDELIYGSIEVLKGAGEELAKAIFKDKGPNGVITEIRGMGYELLDIAFTKIDNADTRLMDAKISRQARADKEAEEKANTQNAIEKIKLRMIAMLDAKGIKLEDLSNDERDKAYRQAEEAEERAEGTRKTIENRGRGGLNVNDFRDGV